MPEGDPLDSIEVIEEDWSVGELRLRLLRPRNVVADEVEPRSQGRRPIWAPLWQSGRALAGHVAGQDLAGARFVELGCGLGLVSLAAAASGARVVVTDRSPLALAFACTSAERNGLSIDALCCDWGEPEELVARAPWDLVVGADVLYDERAARSLLELLPRLVGPRGEVWLADPDRAAARLFLAAASFDWVIRSEWCAPGVLLHRLRRRPEVSGC